MDDKRVALVTGSSGGIGRAIALELASRGIAVAVASRTDDRYPGTNEQTVEMIRAAGGTAEPFEVDLSVAEDRHALVGRVTEKMGPVRILVNNAAVSTMEPLENFRSNRFTLMIDVQVRAPLELSQAAIPGMRAAGGGWIVNVSSPAAFHPALDNKEAGNTTVYGMCKIALERFSTGLAAEVYDDNINVVALAPTQIVATFGAKAFFDVDSYQSEPPEAMAEAVAYLVDEGHPRITGQILYSQGVLGDAGIPIPVA